MTFLTQEIYIVQLQHKELKTKQKQKTTLALNLPGGWGEWGGNVHNSPLPPLLPGALSFLPHETLPQDKAASRLAVPDLADELKSWAGGKQGGLRSP